jgi:hypothetical protein
MKKQTAVEWLVEQVNADCLNSVFITPDLIDQAKAMEKEQIVKAFNEGTFANDEKVDSEQYYIDNYGGKDV